MLMHCPVTCFWQHAADSNSTHMVHKPGRSHLNADALSCDLFLEPLTDGGVMRMHIPSTGLWGGSFASVLVGGGYHTPLGARRLLPQSSYMADG